MWILNERRFINFVHSASKCEQIGSKIRSEIIADATLSRIDLTLFLQLRTVTRLIHHRRIWSLISHDSVRDTRETLYKNVNNRIEKSSYMSLYFLD